MTAGEIVDFWGMVILRLLIFSALVSGSKAVVKRDMSQALNPQTTDPPNFNFAQDGVVELTDKNFQAEVLRSNYTWLVDFDWPGPSCPWCQEFAEIVKNIAQGLMGTPTRIGVVNCRSAEGKKLANRFAITMYPSILIFGKDKAHPLDYKGSKSIDELMETVLHHNSKPYPAAGQCGKDSKENLKSDVYELTDYNFEEAVLHCDEMWVVNFYSAWAKLCMKFFPVFQKAAAELKGRGVKFGGYDLSADSQFQEKYNITKVCTVKMFPAGSKHDIKPVDYNRGQHGVQFDANLIPWVKEHLTDLTSAEEVHELTSFNVLESTCSGKVGRSCIVLVVPEASKCSTVCKPLIGLLNRLSEKYKTENLGWLLVHAGAEFGFEKKFGLSKIPVAMALNLMHKEYTTTSGLLTESKLQEFVQFYSDGRLPLKPIPASALPHGH